MSVQEIKTTDIIGAHSILRPVLTESVEFLELVDSIKENGLFKSLLVRPHPGFKGKFEIIDGMWRFSACKLLDFSEIPCIINTDVKAEEQFLSLQTQANAISYETHPIEFAEQLQKIIVLHEAAGLIVTLAKLASDVKKSVPWVSSRLKLLELCDEAKERVRDGTLSLGKAVALSKIRKPKFQIELMNRADDMSNREFELEVGRFILQKRFEKMDKRRGIRDNFVLLPRLQSMDTMLIELDRLENISETIIKKNLKTPLEGGKAMLEWVLNLHHEGRQNQVKEYKHLLTGKKRRDIVANQRYAEIEEFQKSL